MKEQAFLADEREANGLHNGSITRIVRAVKPQPTLDTLGCWEWQGIHERDSEKNADFWWCLRQKCSFGAPPGRRWVQEEYVEGYSLNEFTELPDWRNPEAFRRWYRATDDLPYWMDCDGKRNPVPWGPCPREASRTLLDLTDVRVIRVREVTEEDYFAMGLKLAPIESYDVIPVNAWVMLLLKQRFGWAVNDFVWIGTVGKVAQ